MAATKTPKKAAVKKVAKAPVKKAAPAAKAKVIVKKAATKAPAKKAAVKVEAKKAVSKVAKPEVVKKAAKKAAPIKKAPVQKLKTDTSNKNMLTKSNSKTASKKFAEEVKKPAPVAKPAKKVETIRVSKNLKLKNDPMAILKAIPKEELKPFTRTDKQNFGVKEKLQALYYLQQLDSRVDEIRTIRGELPMEVQDLQDEVEGLHARIANNQEEVATFQEMILKKKQAVKDSNAQIKKYEAQQMNVKNNREYDSLTKEIEYQQLEIQLSEKRAKEYTYELNQKIAELEEVTNLLAERAAALEQKQNELEMIIGETQKEEERMLAEADKASKLIDTGLLSSYNRVRKNMINGLAVVKIHRDACGGCFNKIPPQMQLEIGQRKKVTICEHCGRILVDTNINDW
jgi:hypothetical protein